MEQKKLSARILTFLTALAMLMSFVVQDWSVTASGATNDVDGVIFDADEDVTILVNGEELTDDMEVNDGDNLEIVLNWELEDGKDITEFKWDLNDLKNISLESGTSGDLIRNGESYGTYSVDNGVVTIKLNADFTESGRTVGVRLEGVVSAKEKDIPDGTSTQLAIAGKTVSVKMNYDPSKITATKTASGDAYYEGGKIYQDYTVTVTADGRVTNAVVNDVMGSNLSNVTNIVTDGTVTETSTGFSVNFGELVDETRTITYTVEVADAVTAQGYDINSNAASRNTLDITYTDNKGDSKENDYVSATPNVTKPSVTKSGVLNESEETVTWTINISTGIYGDNISASDIVVTDTLGDNLSGSGTFSFINKKLSDLISEANKYKSYTVTDNGNGNYTITYTTSVANGIVDADTKTTLENEVTVDMDGTTYTAEAGVTTRGGDLIAKTCEGLDDDGNIKWKVVISVPDEGLTDVWIKDDAQSGSYALQTINFDSITVDGTSVSTILAWNDSTDVNDDYLTNNSLDFAVKKYYPSDGFAQYISFKLAFSDSYIATKEGQDIVVEYTTTPDKDALNSISEFYNYVNLTYGDNNTDNASATYKNQGMGIEKSVAATSGNTITWTLTANLMTTDYNIGDIVSFTDTLPDNMKYVDGSMIVKYNYYNGNYDKGEVLTATDGLEVSVDKTTGVMTVKYTINETDYNAYQSSYRVKADNYQGMYLTFTYETEPDDVEQYINDGIKDYTNTATGYYNDTEANTVSSTQSMTPSGIVDKSVIYDEDYAKEQADAGSKYAYDSEGKGNAEFTIDANEGELNLGGSEVYVLDTLGTALTPVLDSIKVYEVTAGEYSWSDDVETELDSSKYSYVYDPEENTLTFTVPDETYIRIRYWVTIDYDKITTTKNSSGEEEITNGDDVNNTVQVVGYTSNQAKASEAVNGVVFKSSGWVKSETEDITIYKYYRAPGIVAGVGAEFAVYEVTYDSSTGTLSDYKGSNPKGTATVTENGTATISELTKNSIYALVETKAPDGCELPSEPYYFVFEGNTAVDVPESVATTYDPDYYYEIENTYVGETTEITLTKIWDDQSNKYGIRPSNVTFVVTNSNGDVVKPTITVDKTTDSDKWVYTFSDLPEYGTVNGVYTKLTYTVTETVPDEYTNDNNGLTWTGTDLTMTNTFAPSTIDVSGTKTWDDNNNSANERPTSITVNLMNGTTVVATQTVKANADGDWKYSFTNLDEYTYTLNADGTVTKNLITYTVQEDAVTHYTTTYSGYDITNTYVTQVKDISGTKTWVGDSVDTSTYRPTSVELKLYANGVEVDGAQPTWTGTDTNVWTYTYTNMSIYGADGVTPIVYTVKEINVSKYYNESYDLTDLNITNTRKTITKISKQDITGNEIAGAKLEILDANGKVAESWTSEAGVTHEVVGLAAGDYTLRETLAPDGYAIATEVQFTVEDDGSVKTVTMVDEYTKTTINKVDGNGNPVSGATLKLTDASGIYSKTWTTDATGAYTIYGLTTGKTYTLSEVGTPAGYNTAADMAIVVTDNGTFEMVDTLITAPTSSDNSSDKSSIDDTSSDDDTSSIDDTSSDDDTSSIDDSSSDGETSSIDDSSSETSSDDSSDSSSEVSSEESSESSDESSESSEESTSSEASSSSSDSSKTASSAADSSQSDSSVNDKTPDTGSFAGSACAALAVLGLAAATVIKKREK